ncbi:hypothetical protein JGU71_15080 [Antrihabitans sp. YC3-6]|uniref:DUF6779 domain-containing protein n=1 Tax=Antrihabitans stalagmiti TaxID=2799499 RepID=A0A934NRY1_9NOCA|nr:DUF6779 domain-containing protein [Antrihabitans stalagmiti]MBJ8340212.1 hypothetical protein [Antrihabitans stalagmiti]
MTSASRTKSPRRGRRSAGQLILAAMLGLGLIASIFLIFADSVQLLRVGVVAAAWAAIVGGIAMTKYRRESAVDKAKARDLQTVYELQLEREISARREFEMGVEARVRREVRADAEELAGLRAELVALRANLQVLFDGQLPSERVALRADSTRVQELASGQDGDYPNYREPRARDSQNGRDVPVFDRNRPPDPAYVADNNQRPQFATPYDEPVTAEVAAIPEFGPMPTTPASAPEPPIVTTPQQHLPQDDAADTAPEPFVEPEAEFEPEFEPDVDAELPLLPEPAAGSRRRRRAEAEAAEVDGMAPKSISVAELMANLRSETVGSEGSGRRSRHGQ